MAFFVSTKFTFKFYASIHVACTLFGSFKSNFECYEKENLRRTAVVSVEQRHTILWLELCARMVLAMLRFCDVLIQLRPSDELKTNNSSAHFWIDVFLWEFMVLARHVVNCSNINAILPFDDQSANSIRLNNGRLVTHY